MHGLYDLLLGLNLTVYAVLSLVPPLLILINWVNRREFLAVSKANGKVLVNPLPPETVTMSVMRQYFKKTETPWNAQAPWMREKRVRYDLLRDLDEK